MPRARVMRSVHELGCLRCLRQARGVRVQGTHSLATHKQGIRSRDTHSLGTRKQRTGRMALRTVRKRTRDMLGSSGSAGRWGSGGVQNILGWIK